MNDTGYSFDYAGGGHHFMTNQESHHTNFIFSQLNDYRILALFFDTKVEIIVVTFEEWLLF